MSEKNEAVAALLTEMSDLVRGSIREWQVRAVSAEDLLKQKTMEFEQLEKLAAVLAKNVMDQSEKIQEMRHLMWRLRRIAFRLSQFRHLSSVPKERGERCPSLHAMDAVDEALGLTDEMMNSLLWVGEKGRATSGAADKLSVAEELARGPRPSSAYRCNCPGPCLADPHGAK